MNRDELTLREQEYMDCEVPLLTGGSAAIRIIIGIFASVLQSAFLPGSDKADRGLMRTTREIRYTKYKKAIMRKLNGNPKKKDEKLLDKLNNERFILDVDIYDADDYTKQIYEEYMKKNEE